jgi:hypothetical protein
MKRLSTFFLSLVLLVSSITPVKVEAAKKSSCENGECIEDIVDNLEELNELFVYKCLPKNPKKDLEEHFEENGLTEECWKIMTEINHLEDSLQQLQSQLEQKLGRQDGNCSQEVMGIGASDPDAITIVQTIDAQGGVILFYLRNKKNPSEIFVVRGDIEPNAMATSEQIVKTIKLNKN